MTTLNINGKRVKVSDDFLKLSAEEQARVVDEIAAEIEKTTAEGSNSGLNLPPEAAQGTPAPGTPENGPKNTPPGDAPTLGQPTLPGEAEGSPLATPGSPPAEDSWLDTAGKIAGSAAAGVGRGATALIGLPGTAADLFNYGMDSGLKAIGILPEDYQSQPSRFSGEALNKDLSAITGGLSDYKDPSLAGQYAGTIGEFVGGGAGAKLGVLAGVGSETAGQLTKGSDLEPWARFLGALAVPAAGTAVGAAKAGTRSVAGLPRSAADPYRLKLAKVLDDFDVPLTAGQRIGADGLRKAEGATGAGQAMSEAQAEAFTRAALKTAGTDAPRATREVMAATSKRIGDDFKAVTSGIDVTPDSASVTALSSAANNYKNLAPKDSVVPLIAQVRKEFVKSFRAGNSIPASTITTWRSQMSKLTTSPDPATREAAQQALEVLDDSLEASLVAAGRVDDVAKLANARGEWRNYLALQRAVTMAGEDAALGIISPARLASSVTQQGRSAVATGRRGDIGDLADAGVAVMSPLPTVAPGGIRNVPGVKNIVAGSGGAALGSVFGPVGAALGSLGGLVAPGLVEAAQMTGPVQRALVNAGSRQAAPIVSKALGPSLLGATTNIDAKPHLSLIGKY